MALWCHLTSKLKYRQFPFYLLCTLFLFYFHLLPSPVHPIGFSFCSSLVSLSFLPCCHRTTTTCCTNLPYYKSNTCGPIRESLVSNVKCEHRKLHIRTVTCLMSAHNHHNLSSKLKSATCAILYVSSWWMWLNHISIIVYHDWMLLHIVQSVK